MIVARVSREFDQNLTTVHLGGPLTRGDRGQLRTLLHKAIVECPAVIVVDLHDLVDLTGTVLPTLAVIDDHANRDYGVRLLWVLPAEGSLARRAQRPFWCQRLQIHPSPAAALAAARQVPPPPEHLRLVPPRALEAPSHARVAAGEACIAWDLPSLAAGVRRIVWELVHNALTHTATNAVEVTLMRCGRHVHIAVRDDDPSPPRLLGANETGHLDAGPGDLHGSGLRLVDRWATAWGTLTRPPGKTVWATLRIPTGGRRVRTARRIAATDPRLASLSTMTLAPVCGTTTRPPEMWSASCPGLIIVPPLPGVNTMSPARMA